MSCEVEYIELSSPLLRRKRELGTTMKMCMVRSHLLKILSCAGVAGVSRDGVDQTRILTAGSIQCTKGGS